MSRRFDLRKFGAHQAPNARDLSELHARLLPESPVALLGSRFREGFYYKELPELGLIFGTAAYIDDAPAGFIAATHDSDGFMSAALRRRAPRIVWMIGTALLADPRRIAPMWEASRIKADRERSSERGLVGEILSIGVLPEFRDSAFRAATGLYIAGSLILSVMEVFRDTGSREVRAIVDEDNPAAYRFYEKFGWRRSRTGIAGWRHPSGEVAWEPRGSQELSR